MKIKLYSDLPGVGKAGEVVEVEQSKGSVLVCQGVCSVEEFDKPTAKQQADAAALLPEQGPQTQEEA